MDLDALVSEVAGRSIPEVFAAEGEPGFRQRERAALEAVSGAPVPTVVACGGGTPLLEENRALMQRTGASVWLRPGLAELHRRLAPAAERADRPLLADLDWEREGLARLEALEAARAVHYGEARFVASEVAVVQSALDVWATSSK